MFLGITIIISPEIEIEKILVFELLNFKWTKTFLKVLFVTLDR